MTLEEARRKALALATERGTRYCVRPARREDEGGGFEALAWEAVLLRHEAVFVAEPEPTPENRPARFRSWASANGLDFEDTRTRCSVHGHHLMALFDRSNGAYRCRHCAYETWQAGGEPAPPPAVIPPAPRKGEGRDAERYEDLGEIPF